MTAVQVAGLIAMLAGGGALVLLMIVGAVAAARVDRGEHGRGGWPRPHRWLVLGRGRHRGGSGHRCIQESWVVEVKKAAEEMRAGRDYLRPVAA